MDFVISLAHILVDEVAGGRSTVRIFILIIFTVLFGSVFFVANGKKNKNECSTNKKVLFGLIISLFVLGIGSQIYLFHAYGITQNNFAVFFNNREITSTTLTHTHVLKTSAYRIAEILGISYEENVDIGAGIAPFISSIVSYISLIVILLIFLLQLQIGYKIFPASGSKRYRIIWSIVFILIQFVIIKAIIDGGLFSEKVLAWVFAEFLILFPIKKTSTIYYCFLCSIVTTLALNLFFVLIHSIPLWQFEKRFFIEFGINILVLIAVVYISRKSFKRIDVLLGILGIIFLTPSLISGFSIFPYRNTEIIPSDNAVVATYSANPNYRNVLDVGTIKYQLINSTTTIGQISNSMKILDNFEPISIPWKTCVPTGTNNISFYLDSKQKPNFMSTTTAYFTFFIKKDNPNKSFYNVYFSVNNCIPRPLNLLNELGISFGLKQWYIWNIRESDAIFSSKQFE